MPINFYSRLLQSPYLASIQNKFLLEFQFAFTAFLWLYPIPLPQSWLFAYILPTNVFVWVSVLQRISKVIHPKYHTHLKDSAQHSWADIKGWYVHGPCTACNMEYLISKTLNNSKESSFFQTFQFNLECISTPKKNREMWE